ncbi:Sucrase/ferredoxin-like-domain-containing protein [Elsinoe ampelina]|uniref:Sucrase/ferredoxin-like-domain-containing protein n=1 Tax=Elsinoe ampelina TaxID=302913 RepID=A0A6A6G5D4_9PEZI|nr:Sucrase/ferredoxin-like-domain-containing protein [Elsinoe ampelina]
MSTPRRSRPTMTTLFNNLKVKLTNGNAHRDDVFTKAKNEKELFPITNPEVDGEECLHDCESCTVKYPSKWSIDEDDQVYGHINGWSTHLLVATGKTDWVRDVSDENGSVMEAVKDSNIQPTNGKMMLSACNIPLPNHATSHSEGTTVLLLPSFTYIDNVTPTLVPTLIETAISPSPTNTTPLTSPATPSLSPPSPLPSLPAPLSPRPCNHQALILLCSQATRDARCGQSAPLLRRELERHLRPLGLHRDMDDNRPGGVGVYFISHVGGHKYAANVMVYRRGDAGREAAAAVDGSPAPEASQCIWLARVRPEDCENLVRFTVLQGKVVKPERQLRGGFDRGRGLTSW